MVLKFLKVVRSGEVSVLGGSGFQEERRLTCCIACWGEYRGTSAGAEGAAIMGGSECSPTVRIPRELNSAALTASPPKRVYSVSGACFFSPASAKTLFLFQWVLNNLLMRDVLMYLLLPKHYSLP